ncbi:MAG: 1L-myo-inositol 1-phosphate cytidylyltransferase [Verrucomicrobiota bacterium]|jgi:choline kinase
MAGTGSRLRGTADTIAKPLIPIAGRPLISYAIESFDRAGVKRLHAVVGPNGDELAAAVAPLLPPHMEFRPIANPNWQKQNGVSLLTAAGKVNAPFFLAMGDHLFESSILDTLTAQADPTRLSLAVDKKIEAIFDLDDAMKVQTEGNRIVAIGKKLETYNAIDTGIFLCPETIFEYLRRVLKEGDCSLADGVRLMAEERKALAVDIGEVWWQDIDTPEMLARAEEEAKRLAD